MSNFPWWYRPGQLVVCVDALPVCSFDSGRYPRLIKGEVYEVAEVVDLVGIHFKLVGLGDVAWFARRFRPARSASIESLRALLSPTPEIVGDFLEEEART